MESGKVTLATSVVYVQYNDTSPYFDTLKFDVFNMQCALVPLYRVCIAYWQISMCPLRCKHISGFLISTHFVTFTLT